MTRFVLFLTFLLFTFFLSAQINLTGKVTLDGEGVFDADVRIGDSIIYSDENGMFFIELKSGPYDIEVSYAYLNSSTHILLTKDTSITIALDRNIALDEITVSALKATAATPIAYTDVDKKELDDNQTASDVPYILKWQPSMVVTSDAGAGVGYTGMRIRGTDPTRINVTINGIPYNDSESQGAFWVNLPDLISSAHDVQIQRGVGTSTQGAAAFGGSVNINTLNVNPDPYGRISLGIGSFATRSVSVGMGTGLLNEQFSIEGRISKISSDGYVDRAHSELESFYVSGAYKMEKSLLRFVTFGSHEVTYQAWYGLPFQYIDTLRTYNEAGQEKKGSPYEDQNDDFQQQHYQLHFTHNQSSRLSLSASIHYTKGKGFYEEYKSGEKFEEYKLTMPAGVNTTDLIRRKWLDNHFYGIVSHLRYKVNKSLDVTLGGGWNNYLGGHYGDIQWAEYMVDQEKNFRYYDNDAIKNDMNIYMKSHISFTDALRGYVDLQYRRINYSLSGIAKIADEFVNLDEKAHHNFFNPKAGLLFSINTRNSTFLSVAVAHKEPNRDDYTDNYSGSIPRSERLVDIEAQYAYKTSKLNISTNFYGMFYKDQLVLNGQINDVGAYPRINVPNSSRIGVEVYGVFALLANSSLSAGATLSRNKIATFTNYIDNWDTGTQEIEHLENVDIAFSPAIIGQLGLDIQVLNKNTGTRNHKVNVELMNKYVGKQFLDNTQSEERSLPAYFYSDFNVRYSLMDGAGRKMSIKGTISNLFNQYYISNGWSYQYVYSGDNPVSYDPYSVASNERKNKYQQIGYYPQAGIHAYLGIVLEI